MAASATKPSTGPVSQTGNSQTGNSGPPPVAPKPVRDPVTGRFVAPGQYKSKPEQLQLASLPVKGTTISERRATLTKLERPWPKPVRSAPQPPIRERKMTMTLFIPDKPVVREKTENTELDRLLREDRAGFSELDTPLPSQSRTMPRASPISISRCHSLQRYPGVDESELLKRSEFKKRLSEVEKQLTGIDLSRAAKSKSMSPATSGRFKKVLPSPSPHSRIKSIFSTKGLFKSRETKKGGTLELDDREEKIITELKNELKLPKRSQIIDFVRNLNDQDDESAFDTISISSSEASVSTGSLPEMFGFSRSTSSLASSITPSDAQVCTLRNSRVSSILDFDNPDSPICRAVEAQWGVEPSLVSHWEQDRITAYCLRMLREGSAISGSDDEVCAQFQGFLIDYQTMFHTMMSQTCDVLCLQPPVWRDSFVEVLFNDEDFLNAYPDGSVSTSISLKLVELLQQAEEVLIGSTADFNMFYNMTYVEKAAQIHSLERSLKKLGERLEAEINVDDSLGYIEALKNDMEALRGRLDKAAKAFEALRKGDFRNQRSWDQCITVMAKAAQKAVTEDNPDGSVEAINTIDDWRKEQTYPVEGFPMMVREVDSREKALMVMLKKLDTTEKTYERKRSEIIRQTPAQEERKSLMYLFDGEYQGIAITHQPPACFRLDIDGTSGGMDPCGHGGLVIPSCLRDAEHAVNSTVTTVEHDREDVFKEVRTGVPYAFAISNKAEKKRVTKVRLDEMLLICGLTFHRQEMLEAFNRPDKCVELDMFYICLLSPDTLRAAFSNIPGVDDEKLWTKKVFKKLKKRNQKVIELSVRSSNGKEGTIKVKPNVFMFVCPCNQLAFSKKLQFARTWPNADDYNAKTFKRLFGTLEPEDPMAPDSFVQQFLDKNQGTLDPVVRQEIEELSYLLRYMFANQLHHELMEQPFIFSNVISELGRVLNVAIASGCKSAKDRTGNHERCNIDLALRLYFIRRSLTARLKEKYGDHYQQLAGRAIEQVMPPIDRRMTSEDFYNTAMLLLCSGQLENTMNCLGKAGFKIPEYVLGIAKDLYPLVDLYLNPIKAPDLEESKAIISTNSPKVVTRGFLPGQAGPVQ